MTSSKMPSHYGMILPADDLGSPETPSTETASPSITTLSATVTPSRPYHSKLTIQAKGLSMPLPPAGLPPTSPLPPLPTNRGGRKPRPLSITLPENRQLLPAVRPSPEVEFGLGLELEIAKRPTGGVRRVVTESNVNEHNFYSEEEDEINGEVYCGNGLNVKKSRSSSRLTRDVESRIREGNQGKTSTEKTGARSKKWLTTPLTNHPEEIPETPTRNEAQQENVNLKSNVKSNNEDDVDEELERYINKGIRVPAANPYKDNYEFTCALLKVTYRDQSEAFARNAVSRSVTRSVSVTPRSTSLPLLLRSTSETFPGGTGSPSQVITPNNFFTPSRPPSTKNSTRPNNSAIAVAQQGDISTTLEHHPVQQSDGDVFVGAGAENTTGEKITYATYEAAVTSEVIIEKGRNSPITKRITKAPARIPRGYLYFTEEERGRIDELVRQQLSRTPCIHHANCQDCRDIEYALAENRAMNTSIPPEERQKIINNNRSLRNIKNELENLAEHGAISDSMYDTIMASLPAETPLNGTRSTPVQASNPVPTNAFSNLKVDNEPPPPSYTSNSPAAPPSLPSRGSSKPEISRATALYRYAEPEDCCFEVGDEISVFEKMNADWWLGKNTRTGKEGVFPVNYVQVQVGHTPPTPYGAEKASPYPGLYQAPSQGYQPPAPGPSNPYNSSVPPMAIAGSSSNEAAKPPGKGGEMGKKFGKKLGNAAIFGAGATIGGNIVNSIF